MNPHELMMKAHCGFVCVEDLVLDLVLGVVKQVAKLNGHLGPVDPNVFVAFAKCTGPLLSFVKHLAVKISNKTFIQKISLFLTCCPAITLNDVDLLPSIKIALSGDV